MRCAARGCPLAPRPRVGSESDGMWRRPGCTTSMYELLGLQLATCSMAAWKCVHPCALCLLASCRPSSIIFTNPAEPQPLEAYEFKHEPKDFKVGRQGREVGSGTSGSSRVLHVYLEGCYHPQFMAALPRAHPCCRPHHHPANPPSACRFTGTCGAA